MIWMSEKRKISDLKPAEYNPRQSDDREWANLKESLKRFDLADPIIINKDNTIIGGHFRIRVLEKEGIEEVDVRVPEEALTKEDEKELNLRLNKNLGEWDNNLLANFDEDMLINVGFTPEELEGILQINLEPDEKDDIVPEVRETDIKSGDIFQLGEHRLLCGDATKNDDVEKLMQGEKADMVFTDPPCGVGYVQGKYTGLNPKKKFNKIANDEKKGDDLYNFIYDAFTAIIEKTNRASFYVWSPALLESMAMLKAITDAGIKIQCQIIWNKDSLVLSRSDYHWKHENCWYGFKKDSPHTWFGDRKQTTVWDIKRDRSYKHPTQKPVELANNAINNSTERSNIVLDIFGGSGSTLIACEKTNRKCRMMEIDPIYCQVIVDRWEEYTNQKSIKL